MTRLQSNFYGKLERKTREAFPKNWRGYGCEFLAKQTIKFYAAYLEGRSKRRVPGCVIIKRLAFRVG